MPKPGQHSDEEINNWFTYHPPNGPGVVDRYARIRASAKRLALTIRDNCPAGADRSAAMRHLREAVMTANAGIACASEEGA